MGIRSLFTSHERLFAEWMMHLKFNETIQAEPCFPGLSPRRYTNPQEFPPIRKPSEEEKKAIREIWSARLRKEQVSEAVVDIPKQIPVYQMVENQIQNVKKQPFLKDNRGWGKTCFAVTNKQTGYFLVENLLVVSAGRDVFKVNTKGEKVVAYKTAEELEEDAIKLVQKIQDWLDNRNEKLSDASKISFAVLALFSLMGKWSSDANPVVSTVLPMGCIAMGAMNVYLTIKLYQLHSFKEETNGIQNLGDWVWKIRSFARKYPDLLDNAPNYSHKFFTPGER